MSGKYEHPPLTEAVVEFRYEDGRADLAELERARARLAAELSKVDELRQLTLRADAVRGDLIGYKFTSTDGTRVVQLRPELLSASRLAPYAGWSDLLAHVRQSLRLAGAMFRGRKITRIAARFINRFDIPDDSGGVAHQDYFNVGVSALPVEHGPIGLMGFNLSTTIDGGRFGLNLQGGRVFAPLINTTSVLLDMDVFNQDPGSLPRSLKGAFGQLEEIHEWLVRIFEGCITDKARDLIS